LLDSAYEKVSK